MQENVANHATALTPSNPRSKSRIKSAAALTERAREFERVSQQDDAIAGGSRRNPIGQPQTQSAASTATPHSTPNSPPIPPPSPNAGNRPAPKAKPARFRGPVRNSPIRTGSNRRIRAAKGVPGCHSLVNSAPVGVMEGLPYTKMLIRARSRSAPHRSAQAGSPPRWRLQRSRGISQPIHPC